MTKSYIFSETFLPTCPQLPPPCIRPLLWTRTHFFRVNPSSVTPNNFAKVTCFFYWWCPGFFFCLMAKFTCLIHESVYILRMYRNLQINHFRVIYDRIQNRKKYFEITAFLNFECGASRLGYLNENLNFTGLDFPRSIGRKAGISKYVFFFC